MSLPDRARIWAERMTPAMIPSGRLTEAGLPIKGNKATNPDYWSRTLMAQAFASSPRLREPMIRCPMKARISPGHRIANVLPTSPRHPVRRPKRSVATLWSSVAIYTSPIVVEARHAFNDNRRTHIFIADLVSGQTRQLTKGDSYEHSVDWSPKGDEIVYVTEGEPD